MLNPIKIQKQLTWLTEQIKCLKSQACSCEYEETSLEYSSESGQLIVTFVDGSTRETNITPGTNITKTSDLINDGEDGTFPYVTTDNLPPFALVPENTSDLNNDGENGVNPFITLNDIPYQISKHTDLGGFPPLGNDNLVYLAEDTGIFYLWNGDSLTYVQITNNAFPTGLQRITEGGRTGWRLINRDPNNYGDIGEGAVDLSRSTSASATRGATGADSFAVGLNVVASATQAVALGSSTQATSQYSFAHGNFTQATNNSAEAGGNNSIASGNSSVGKGLHSRARSCGELSVGHYGTDYTATNPSGVSQETDRAFNIGNGLGNLSRSDAFTVYKNGAVRIFRATLAFIANAAAGFLIANTSDKNRLNYHDGTEWKGLEYKKKTKIIVGTSYTLIDEDKDRILHFTSNSDIVLTISSGLDPTNRYEGKQLGTGQILFGADIGVTLRVGASELAKTAEQYSVFGIDIIGPEEYMLFGKLELV